MKSILNHIATSVAVCLLPVASYAGDVNVINHTKGSATANAYNSSTSYHSPCSSFLGAAGIIGPEYNSESHPFTIPGWAVSSVCAPKCEVNVYMDKSCTSGKLIATGVISPSTGIGEVKNVQNAEGYYITKKDNNTLVIEGGAKATIFDMMFRKLGV